MTALVKKDFGSFLPADQTANLGNGLFSYLPAAYDRRSSAILIREKGDDVEFCEESSSSSASRILGNDDFLNIYTCPRKTLDEILDAPEEIDILLELLERLEPFAQMLPKKRNFESELYKFLSIETKEKTFDTIVRFILILNVDELQDFIFASNYSEKIAVLKKEDY